VVKDVVDPVLDERLAEFVVSSHMRAHPSAVDTHGPAAPTDPDILPQEMLRKYITYAKQNTHPKLQNADYDKIATVSFPPPPHPPPPLRLIELAGVGHHRREGGGCGSRVVLAPAAALSVWPDGRHRVWQVD